MGLLTPLEFRRVTRGAPGLYHLPRHVNRSCDAITQSIIAAFHTFQTSKNFLESQKMRDTQTIGQNFH